MKVEKINKGKEKRVAVLMLAILAVGSLVACTPEVTHATPTDTPVATQKATNTPTNTPTPSPTEVPTPTPTPQLTYEQKELLLGDGKTSRPCKIGTIRIYNFDLKGKKYRVFTVANDNAKKSKDSNGDMVVDIFDVFTRQYLFSLNYPNNGVGSDGQEYSISQGTDFLSETNSALTGMKLEHAFTIDEVAYYYKIWEIEYNNDEFLNSLSDLSYGEYTPDKMDKIKQMRQIVLTFDKMKEVFLNSTPQEEIMPYWVYTPGATIPEELKGIYSEVDYPPASAEITVQQGNRIYGYKEFTSKDGAASISYPFERITHKELVDDNVIHGYRMENNYNKGYTKTKI